MLKSYIPLNHLYNKKGKMKNKLNYKIKRINMMIKLIVTNKRQEALWINRGYPRALKVKV